MVSTKEVKTEIVSGKSKAIDVAIAQIEKQFGKGSIMKLGSKERVNVEVIPTGALSLDIALGIGGVPKVELLKYMVQSHQGRLL